MGERIIPITKLREFYGSFKNANIAGSKGKIEIANTFLLDNEGLSIVNIFQESISQWANYSNLDEHFHDREIDSVKRKHFYLQAEEILLDEMPVTAIFSITSRAFKKKKLKMDLSSTLLNLKWAYFCDHEL